eukprot:jgi/Tetstr1/453429/TSEL_040411.t1
MAPDARPVDAETHLYLLHDRVAKAESAAHTHYATAAACVHAASRPAQAPPVAPVAAPTAKRGPNDKAFVETVKAPKGTSGTTHTWMDALGAIHARHTYEASVMQAEIGALRALTPSFVISMSVSPMSWKVFHIVDHSSRIAALNFLGKEVARVCAEYDIDMVGAERGG